MRAGTHVGIVLATREQQFVQMLVVAIAITAGVLVDNPIIRPKTIL